MRTRRRGFAHGPVSQASWLTLPRPSRRKLRAFYDIALGTRATATALVTMAYTWRMLLRMQHSTLTRQRKVRGSSGAGEASGSGCLVAAEGCVTFYTHRIIRLMSRRFYGVKIQPRTWQSQKYYAAAAAVLVQAKRTFFCVCACWTASRDALGPCVWIFSSFVIVLLGR